MPEKFTTDDKVEALNRELKYRRYVYDRRISEGRMKLRDAHQIEIFEAILRDYIEKRQEELLL